MEVNENIFEGFTTTNEKKSKKTKCVSNDRSRHDDSNGPRIVKIGAILAIFEHFKVGTSAQGHARLFAQGQGWLIVSVNDCTYIPGY